MTGGVLLPRWAWWAALALAALVLAVPDWWAPRLPTAADYRPDVDEISTVADVLDDMDDRGLWVCNTPPVTTVTVEGDSYRFGAGRIICTPTTLEGQP